MNILIRNGWLADGTGNPIYPADVKPALDRLTTTSDIEAAGTHADFIVESIVEVLEAKKDLFSKLDAVYPRHTIFASNISSLMPTMLAAATQRKDRFLVAHYFNPPDLMPLIEIVRGRHTSDEVVDAIYTLYLEMGKRPIICQKEAPGFIANRLQLVLWREAFNIVQRGIARPQDLDQTGETNAGSKISGQALSVDGFTDTETLR